jgi:hypothetical protein
VLDGVGDAGGAGGSQDDRLPLGIPLDRDL